MDITGSHEVNSDPTMADAILDCLLRKARGPPSISSRARRCAKEHDGTMMSYMKEMKGRWPM